MSVLVIGASGYIGFAVAQRFRQNGYRVYGLVRKQEQSSRLAAEEIIPVVGDANKPETYENVLKHAHVVIDTSLDLANPPQSHIIDAVKKHQTPHGKKIFIFTSGILVHGHHEEVVTEEVLDTPAGVLQVRAKFEAEVINAKEVHGIVIRPGFVYGYAGGNGSANISEKVFNIAANNGKIILLGKKDRRHSWVHIHDLASAYFLAVKQFSSASGHIFDIASPEAPTYEELYKKIAAVAGHKDAELVVQPFPENFAWGTFLNQTVRVSFKKAQTLLGWTPSHPNVIDDLEPVFEAYKANKK